MIKESAWLRFVDEELNPNWPQSPWLPPTITVGFRLCHDADLDQLRAALQTIAREGSHFPPTPGELYKRVADLSLDYPEWGAVWAEIQQAISDQGSYSTLMEGCVVYNGYNDLALRHAPDPHIHYWSSPLVEELVKMVGWAELCTYDLDQERTMEAQCRNKYEALVGRARQDSAWAGIPASGLARLEATADRRRLSQGTSVGDVLKQLPGAKGE